MHSAYARRREGIVVAESQKMGFVDPIWVPSVDVSRVDYPLTYELMTRLSNRGIDARVLMAIRQHKVLMSSTLAWQILKITGELVADEIVRRVFAKPKPRYTRFPFRVIVAEAAINMPDLLELVIILRNPKHPPPDHRPDDGWAVLLGNVWDVIGAEDNPKGDPFAVSPPDFAQFEKMLTGLIDKTMNRIPMEMLVAYLSTTPAN